MILKYLIAWFGMMVLAIINGAFRDLVYKPLVGEHAAHQISTIILLILLAGYFRVLVRKWPIEYTKQAWVIGVLWFLMTEIFEFGMGLLVAGHPFDKLLQNYNLFGGQLWLLIPLWVLIGPYVFYRFVQAK